MGFWERRGSLMVIYDFDFVDVFAFPTKAEAPLVIDANAVLTSYNLSKCNAVLSQRFVAVVGYSRRRARLQRRGEREFPSGGFPAAFSSSAVRLTVLRSFSPVSYPWLLARPVSRSSSVGTARRPSSRTYNCARTVSMLTLRCRCPKPVDSSANRCSLRAASSSASHGSRSCR